MKNRGMFSFLSVFFFASFVGLLSSVDTTAQGRYTGQYSRMDVSNIIQRMEESSDEFSRDFNRALDDSNFSSSQKRNYRRTVNNFENAVDRLRNRFDSDDSWWESRNEVRSMISQATPVDTLMNSISFRRNLERQWNRLRNDVNKVADTYDLPGISGGGWNGGGGGGNWGGGTINPPNWAEGTFYGTAPNGSQIVLTISSNGSVNANIGGGMSYGTFTRGNVININGNTSRVYRQGNGIRTVSSGNGETIVYTRSGWGGGGGIGNAPTWAVGRFRGRNPMDNSWIIMTIERGGSVTVNIGGSYSYGTLNGSTLTIDGSSSTVYRRGNGIRTVSNTDGQTINYSRY